MNRSEQKKSIRIGLTGGMGSGKSSVAALWCAFRPVLHIDADRVCRELLEPEAPGWKALRAAFPGRFLNADGSVDRQQLRRALFGDRVLREQLNEIIHPLAREVIADEVKINLGNSAGLLVVEVPLLFEAGWRHDFDKVVVVYADAGICLQRLMERDRLSTAEAQAAGESQMPLVEKALQADYVLDNSGGLLETSLQLLHLDKVLCRGVR